MQASPSLLLFLLQLLIGHAVANSAATCTSPISAEFNRYPECARSCMGCIDSNESFAHGCDINSGACCQGSNALAFIPLVYACVSTTCGGAGEAQNAWEKFMEHCARVGSPVDERDTPAGYEYSSVVVPATITTQTGTTAPSTPTTGTGSNGAGTNTGTPSTDSPSGSTTSPAPQQPASDGGSKSGLGTGEIVGVALGAVSAVAALIGLYFRWKHLRLAKKNVSAANPEDGKP